MSDIIIASDPNASASDVAALSPVMIESKHLWSDDWEYNPDLEMISLSLHASSTAPSSATIRRRYGTEKQPYDTALSSYERWEFTDWWVRISFVGNDGAAVQFVGKIQDQSLEMLGSADMAAGIQDWVAVGGLRILSKLSVSQSVFLVSDDTTRTVDWVPAMNKKDRHGFLTGNATSFVDGDGVEFFYYGGEDTWSHLDYLWYLITNFVQQDNGPVWSVGGQTDILDGMETTIDFGESELVADMFRKLIPPRYGVDFHIIPTELGFEVNIFSLLPEAQSFGGVSMPGNPNQIFIDKTSRLDLQSVRLVESKERRVDQIRVIGKRIVVCGTLSAALNELVPKWSTALEAEYIAAAGAASNDPEDKDKFRARDRYRMVYQQYGAPENWDMGLGGWAVECDLNGEPGWSPVAERQFQTSIRATLPWIPLREGFDYTTDPPTDNTTSGHEADVKPPMVFVYDSGADFVETPIWGLIHSIPEASVSVQVPSFDWGVILNGSPNHILARTHWTDAQTATTVNEPRYDYETLLATIAIESDHRLQVGYDTPEELSAGDGSIMYISDMSAELWVMLPETTVDTTASGSVPVRSGAGLRVLRNDSDRLKLSLAGAISRYVLERTRASARFKGYMPWGHMLGYVLSVVQSGDEESRVGSPVTSIDFVSGKSPETILKTGYA